MKAKPAVLPAIDAMAEHDKRTLLSLQKRVINPDDINKLRLTPVEARSRLEAELQQDTEKSEYGCTTVSDFREYFRTLRHWGQEGYIRPVARNWIELQALVLNAQAARRAAYKEAPSARAVPIEVGLHPCFQKEYRESTIFLEENVRSGGNTKSAHAQARMEERGVDKLMNAKGDMLVALRAEKITVCRDGLNSLTAHIEQDEDDGIKTVYYFRLHAVDPDEDIFVDHLLDDHTGRRGARLTMQLIDSKGRKLRGWDKERTFDMVRQLVCFDHNKWDNSHPDTDDQHSLRESYMKHRKNIETVLSHDWIKSNSGNPRLKGFAIKPATIATLIYALHYYRHDQAALKKVNEFIAAYGTGNITTGIDYVDALRDFVDCPYELESPAVYKGDVMVEAAAPYGERAKTQVMIAMTSIWITRFVKSSPITRTKKGWSPRKKIEDHAACTFKGGTSQDGMTPEMAAADYKAVKPPTNVLREIVKNQTKDIEERMAEQRKLSQEPGHVVAGRSCRTTADAILGRAPAMSCVDR